MTADIDVVVIGHMTVDLVPGGRELGGTVSYAAATYAAFGHKAAILTSAARNEPLLHELEPFAELRVLPAPASLTYENVYGERGRRQYVRATARPLPASSLPDAWLNAPYLHLGPLAGEIDPREMAQRFPSATKMLTMQGMMRRWDEDGLVGLRHWYDEEALQLVDIVVYSEEDVQKYPQLTDRVRRLCPHLLVTNGRHGGTHYHDGGARHYASIDVEPLDLTGAGDVFAASLLASLPRLGGDVHKAVQVAGRLAAYSVTRRGLDSAPKPQEIERETARVFED